jgi:hypothetical protein
MDDEVLTPDIAQDDSLADANGSFADRPQPLGDLPSG